MMLIECTTLFFVSCSVVEYPCFTNLVHILHIQLKTEC